MKDGVIILRGHSGVGEQIEAKVLVSHHGFSARYDLDRERGIFSRESHDLYGMSYVGLILVHPTAKGGVATSWMLHQMKSRGMAPAGLIFRVTNPIMVQGAVLAGIPLMADLDTDPTEIIQTGDRVFMDPCRGEVRVFKTQR
ncbi:MAG: DUF126 domain-containing protein [Deltaproteobacteria bacterium]|nr:DUF126 domain-containing protein [Deltaproteobacteria bacterium]MBW2305565.1 DUF126 domain-containing protein [Deltaproteobacteria bacterium]